MSEPLTAGQAGALRESGRIRVTWRDDSLPHQIRLYLISQDIAVSCSCMRGRDGGSQCSPLEVRSRWDAGEALAVYRAHLDAEAVPA